MTKRRRLSLEEPASEDLARRVRPGTRSAVVLRGAIAVVSLAILSVVTVMLGN